MEGTIVVAEGNETASIVVDDSCLICVKYGSVCLTTVGTAKGAYDGHLKISETAGIGHCVAVKGKGTEPPSGHLYITIANLFEGTISKAIDVNYAAAEGIDK